MTESKPGRAPRIAPAGLMFLAITSVGWGFNWPVTKYLLSELPPLTLRGGTGVVGGGCCWRCWRWCAGQSLRVAPPTVAAAVLAAAAQCHGAGWR